MANSHTTPNNLSSHSFITNSANYGHFTPSYPTSPLDGRFPQSLASTSRQPLTGQENVSIDVLNYPISRSVVDQAQVLQQAEAENSLLRRKLLLMETEKQNNANHEQFNGTKKSSRKPNTIRHLAHAFAFSRFLWIPESASVVSKARFPANFDPSTRYSFKPTTADAAQAHALNVFLWELEDFLPDELKYYSNDEKIMASFLTQMQAFRSDLQHSVRANAATLLSEFDELLPSDAEDINDPARRAANPRFKELLAFDSNPLPPKVSYPLVAPIIDQGGVGGLFKTDNIRKFLVILLFGKSQLSSKSGVPAISKSCNASHWNVTAITPNMVAIAATMLRYMISPDRAFTPVGTTSQIDWLSTYGQYRNNLILDAETSGLTSLFDDLNSQLFGGRQARPRRPVLLENPLPAEDNSLQLAFASLRATSAAQANSHLPASPSTQVMALPSTTNPSATPGLSPFSPSPAVVQLSHRIPNPPSRLPVWASQPQDPNYRAEQRTGNHATGPIDDLYSTATDNNEELGEPDAEELMAIIERELAEEATEDSDSSALTDIVDSSASTLLPPPAPTSNLALLAAAATSTQEQLPIPSSTGRATRGAVKRVYEDLDENGELEPEATPKHKSKKPKRTPAGASVGNEKNGNGNGAGRGRGGHRRGGGRGASNGTGRGR